MLEQPTPVREPPSRLPAERSPHSAWLNPRRRLWVLAAFGVAVAALLFVLLTGMRPAYDAYGWLVWGHQALNLSLNTDAAPSWKPLSFLFTLPYALTGRFALWLWMETATAFALAGAVFGGRIAYRLTNGPGVPRYAPIAAALVAGAGVLGIDGYGHFVLIADTDPMIVTLCLAAIDLHLSDRHRLTWLALLLASLGRPEAWVLTFGYAVWLWTRHRQTRRLIVLSVLAGAALWFVIPRLTSPSWTIAGDIASRSSAGIKGGSHTLGVLDRFFSLYELPMWLMALAGLALAALRRDRRILVLAATAVVWVAVEDAFAFHGWPATPRYMFEAAAVGVVIAGYAVGRLLGFAPGRLREQTHLGRLLRVVGIALAVVFVVAMLPHARFRGRLLHNGIVLGRQWSHQIQRLQSVVRHDGGVTRILSCGHPVTEISWQSILAWDLKINVADVNWDVEGAMTSGEPMVLFEPHNIGWVVTPINMPAAQRARCESLGTVSSFS
jgi:hypothetical protein